MSLSTDRTVYEVSLLDYNDISPTTVMRKYKVTDKYAKIITFAASQLKHDRDIGQEWHLFENDCPPCFTHILISDGEAVGGAVCNEVCNTSSEFIKQMLSSDDLIQDAIWWKLLPKGPREEYGIE